MAALSRLLTFVAAVVVFLGVNMAMLKCCQRSRARGRGRSVFEYALEITSFVHAFVACGFGIGALIGEDMMNLWAPQYLERNSSHLLDTGALVTLGFLFTDFLPVFASWDRLKKMRWYYLHHALFAAFLALYLHSGLGGLFAAAWLVSEVDTILVFGQDIIYQQADLSLLAAEPSWFALSLSELAVCAICRGFVFPAATFATVTGNLFPNTHLRDPSLHWLWVVQVTLMVIASLYNVGWTLLGLRDTVSSAMNFWEARKYFSKLSRRRRGPIVGTRNSKLVQEFKQS